MLFQLLDVLIWFRLYVDSNPKTGNWVKVEEESASIVEVTNTLISGKVINLNPQKGFAFFQPDAIGDNVFIPPHLVTNHSLADQMRIEVETESYLDNRSNETKTRVKRVFIR